MTLRSNRQHRQTTGPQDPGARAGFTLVELLVVVSILLVLAVMTVGAINVSINGDRVRGSARQVQSSLEGAKDRAIYAGENRGLRLILDKDDLNPNKRTVSSMVFLTAGELYADGRIEVYEDDNGAKRLIAGRVDTTTGIGTSFGDLRLRGLLPNGTRIRIEGRWYSIIEPANPNQWSNYISPLIPQDIVDNMPNFDINEFLHLSNDYIPQLNTPSPWSMEVPPIQHDPPLNGYQLELPPTVMPNQEVMTLAPGAVIDLSRSKVPGSWRLPNGAWREALDVMFSPRGTVTGTVAAEGLLHFYVCDQRDAEAPAIPGGPAPTGGDLSISLDPADPRSVGDKVLVSVFTQTGSISVHPVDITDANQDGRADDPYRFAETGEVAAQ